MRRVRAVHVLTVVALAVPAALSSWAVSGPASAATPISCAAVNGGSGQKLTLTKCTDVARTGGKGTAVSAFKAGGTGTMKITWNKKGTTSIAFTYTFPTFNVCGGTLVEIVETGKVVGGTGAALASIKKGQKTTVRLCQGATTVSLLKGTKFTL